MPPQARKILGWSLLGLLGLFILLNFRFVQVNFFYVLRVELPLAIVIFLSASMGAGAILALSFIQELKKDKGPDK